MKTAPARGSHLPVLMKLLPMTQGPVFELGCGMYSTPYLHWYCFAQNRRLVTYENNPKYMEFANQFAKGLHEVVFVEDWHKLDLSAPCSIAFVDHAPDRERYLEMERLTHAEYVVAHDAENANRRKYHYDRVFPLYKYRDKYSAAFPYTLILSNTHDVRGLI